MIISLHQSVMNYIGYQYVIELNLNCSLVYKCLHQSVSSYLAAMCVNINEMDGRRHLRSAVRVDLVKPTTRGQDVRAAQFRRGGTIYMEQSTIVLERLLACNK